jgi:UDP-glucose 4-epimerase
MSASFDAPSLKPGAGVLVVGGRGFVGSHVVRTLVARGYRVHVLGPAMDCDLLADMGDAIDETVGGLEDRELLRDLLARFKPAAVVSCAAFGAGREGLMRSGERDADRAFAINVDGFRRLIETMAEAGIGRLVWTSSTVVYGPARDYTEPRVDETSPKRPGTVYGLTKHLAEEVANFARRRYGLEVIGLRLPLVLGPGLWYQGAAAALAELLRAAGSRGVHRIAFHDRPIDVMHVRDVASACLATLQHAGPLASVYNINGFTASAADLVAEVRARSPDLIVTFERTGPGDLFPLVSDARFRRDLGFVPAFDLAALVADMASAGENE